ncbi:helix-turn-helix domain-containing protein [Sphingobacterium hotanense]|uniref:helix-turn-helix domain-containing protein n=1 Tax=Sphingobacterium hotanense TaxID=649196 RepID=UPI0021A6DB97|nr:helix-turn-helix domain-containing protein [Sphingobacterium hotanense]MCT1526833.1 helix-turn-helix domain-containing protein [Sphingobacterium hotanense]
MEIDIVTKKDLQQFKQEILEEMRSILANKKVEAKDRQWLRSAEVREVLCISPGTLQNLRINSTLPYQKIGGTMYYRTEDIDSMMEGRADHG